MSAESDGRRGRGDPACALHDGSPTVRLLTSCVDAFHVDGAAVALLGAGGGRELVHVTSSVAQHLDEMQFVLGEGPCLDAFHSGTAVLVPDLTAKSATCRWPVLTAEAGQVGVGAMFAFPLQAGSVPFGVLELYRGTPGVLKDDGPAGEKLLERLVLVVLGEATSELRSRDLDDGLPESGQADINRAVGMIAAQLRVSVQEALSRLRATAFGSGLPIDQVASEVLDRTRIFSQDAP